MTSPMTDPVPATELCALLCRGIATVLTEYLDQLKLHVDRRLEIHERAITNLIIDVSPRRSFVGSHDHDLPEEFHALKIIADGAESAARAESESVLNKCGHASPVTPPSNVRACRDSIEADKAADLIVARSETTQCTPDVKSADLCAQLCAGVDGIVSRRLSQLKEDNFLRDEQIPIICSLLCTGVDSVLSQRFDKLDQYLSRLDQQCLSIDSRLSCQDETIADFITGRQSPKSSRPFPG